MYLPCDEPVPGAKVEAFDVDCWWFWMKKNRASSTTTHPDGTFEITFRWCCLLQLPIKKPMGNQSSATTTGRRSGAPTRRALFTPNTHPLKKSLDTLDIKADTIVDKIRPLLPVLPC